MAWNKASLQVFVHGGNSSGWVYPMAASIPREWLSKCQQAVPRPQWEPIIYYVAAVALMYALLVVRSIVSSIMMVSNAQILTDFERGGVVFGSG